ETPTIKKISVIGPGMMGHAIAQEFAVAGYEVMLCGRSEERLKLASDKIERSLIELTEWEIISENAIGPSLERLQTTTDLTAAGSSADLIVEAVVEELEIKHELFSKLETICPQDTIFASNTSSILPSVLAAATRRPDRFLVAHYFNPPYLMPLVEIVRGKETSDATVDVVYNLMKSMGKSPIICQKEAPGFIANRLQLVLWREAFNIVQKGIASPQDVDLAVKNSFGRRLGMVGPFELYEYIDGYDLTLQCEKYMLPDMDTSSESYPLLLEKVEKGELGAKTGKGFYEWTPEFTEAWRKKVFKGLVAYMKSARY
ncbi:MAG: 3-hydroxyacyl-CoA dehydrogenase family protein, partial [Desulfobacterales bacterium]